MDCRTQSGYTTEAACRLQIKTTTPSSHIFTNLSQTDSGRSITWADVPLLSHTLLPLDRDNSGGRRQLSTDIVSSSTDGISFSPVSNTVFIKNSYMVTVAECNPGISILFTANLIQRHVSQAIVYFLKVKVTFWCVMFNSKLLLHTLYSSIRSTLLCLSHSSIKF